MYSTDNFQVYFCQQEYLETRINNKGYPIWIAFVIKIISLNYFLAPVAGLVAAAEAETPNLALTSALKSSPPAK